MCQTALDDKLRDSMVSSIADLKQLYETDYDRWLEQTVKLMKSHQLEQLDLDHLIEELEALSRSERHAVDSLVIQIIEHLLLYEYWQKERDYNARHWRSEIAAFRTQLELRLTNNLKNYLANRMDYLYSKARKISQLKSELKLPETTPYSLDEILDEDWLPDID
jgi:hypothetical protein